MQQPRFTVPNAVRQLLQELSSIPRETVRIVPEGLGERLAHATTLSAPYSDPLRFLDPGTRMVSVAPYLVVSTGIARLYTNQYRRKVIALFASPCPNYRHIVIQTSPIAAALHPMSGTAPTDG